MRMEKNGVVLIILFFTGLKITNGRAVGLFSDVSTSQSPYNCKSLKDGHECTSAKIFIGIIQKFPINMNAVYLFKNEIVKFLSDCELWNFKEIKVIFANEYGQFLTCSNISDCLYTLETSWIDKHLNFLNINKNGSTDIMKSSFETFFAKEQAASLAMAYILTDLTEDTWNQSRFVETLAKMAEFYSDVINNGQIYTKFIQYTEDSITRPGCCRFTKLHEKSHYYFDELILLHDHKDVKINSSRTYSLCKELPRNYTSTCKIVGLDETLQEYDHCTSWHITVFLMLDRSRATSKDITKIQYLLNNIMNSCTGQQTILLNIIIMGHSTTISCLSELECTQKIHAFITLDKATTVWKNHSIETITEQAMAGIILSLQEGQKYESNVLYIISNIACDKEDEFYWIFKKKFFEYNYALALWTRQYRIVTKLILQDGNKNESCRGFIHPVVRITNGYLKFYQADENYEHFEDQIRLCPEITGWKSTLVTGAPLVDIENSHQYLIFMSIPILVMIILTIGYFFKKYCAPKSEPYKPRSFSTNSYTIDIWKIHRSTIDLDRRHPIGKGAYSIVYKAYLKDEDQVWSNIRKRSMIQALGIKKSKNLEVVIKVFHPDSNSSHEIEIMKELGYHPHVINFVGWVLIGRAPSMVLEYCPKRDLLQYLHTMKESFCEAPKPDGRDYENLIGLKSLTKIAWEISDALVFLSSKNLVHRDIAARNVMLTENLVGKLGDFGLCQKINSQHQPPSGKLPIKWMALESLAKGGFSTKTDVWSFGVLLYEIFSFGEVPYKDIESIKLYLHLREGYRLEQPESCPDALYNLMSSCWHPDASQRPNFQEIQKILSSFIGLESDDGYITFVYSPE